jgi:hypothetical protein
MQVYKEETVRAHDEGLREGDSALFSADADRAVLLTCLNEEQGRYELGVYVANAAVGFTIHQGDDLEKVAKRMLKVIPERKRKEAK